jgi:hypothetical protein
VIEAPDRHGMVLTSTLNSCKVMEIIYVVEDGLSGVYHPHTITTLAQSLNISLFSSLHLQCKGCHDLIIEAPDPYGMVPISTSNMHKGKEIRSLGSIIMWLPQLSLKKTLDSSQIAISHLQCKGFHGQVIEAPDPHGTLPTLASNIYIVINIIHMLLRMVTGIHYSAVISTLVGSWFRFLISNKLLFHNWKSNKNAMVQ